MSPLQNPVFTSAGWRTRATGSEVEGRVRVEGGVRCGGGGAAIRRYRKWKEIEIRSI